MIAVDTNVLVYAHREDTDWHETAFARITELAEGKGPWAIPWPCIHEFLAIVTHPRIYSPPTPLNLAVDQIEAWMEAPNLVLLGELEGYWKQLRALLEAGKISGPMVHDARIAAFCLLHGISELWTADRDFSRFPNLKVRNPFVPT
jgi:toxin-antitoxin system PIN domain toxin